MGYDTKLRGKFEITPPLTKDQIAYLIAFSQTRRVKRDPELLKEYENTKLRIEAGILAVGENGEFFIPLNPSRSKGFDKSVIDMNNNPETQPSLYCQWVPSDDGKYLEWDQTEKFYGYREWLGYIISNFIEPWGRTLKGTVLYTGGRMDDYGLIEIVNNKISNYHQFLETIEICDEGENDEET